MKPGVDDRPAADDRVMRSVETTTSQKLRVRGLTGPAHRFVHGLIPVVVSVG